MKSKYPATSLLEAAICLLVFGIVCELMRSRVLFVQEQYQQLAIERQISEIATAAARYAAREGYLPLPEDVPCPHDTKPDILAELQLRGPVPWKKLGLRAPKNAAKFVWIVSPTAVYRGHRWRYWPVSRYTHMLPSFWRDPYQATFARPRWCGLHEEIWWPECKSDRINVGLRSYVASKSDYRYTLQVYKRDLTGEYTRDKIEPEIVILQPHIPGAIGLGAGLHPKLFELYALESRLSMYVTPWRSETYSAMTRWLNNLGALSDTARSGRTTLGSLPTDASIPSAVELSELCHAVFLGQVYRAVWSDPVLAIEYKESIEAPPPGHDPVLRSYVVLDERNPRRAQVWSRSELLAKAGYCDSDWAYTAAGYSWQPVKNASEGMSRYEKPVKLLGDPGPSIIAATADKKFFILGKTPSTDSGNPVVSMCTSDLHKLSCYTATIYDTAGLATRNGVVLTLAPCINRASGCELCLTDFLLRWYEVVLGLDRLEPLRAGLCGDQYGVLVKPSMLDLEVEFETWLEVLERVTTGLRMIANELGELD
jgi:hypothetical protein